MGIDNLEKLADAFGLEGIRVNKPDEVEDALKKAKEDYMILKENHRKSLNELKQLQIEVKNNIELNKLELKHKMMEFVEDSLLKKIDGHYKIIPFESRYKKLALKKANLVYEQSINDSFKVLKKHSEIRIIENELEKTKSDIELLKYKINKSIIVAPAAGTICILDDNKVFFQKVKLYLN